MGKSPDIPFPLPNRPRSHWQHPTELNGADTLCTINYDCQSCVVISYRSFL